MTIRGLGKGRYEIEVQASYGMMPFVLDSVIVAKGKKQNGKKYNFTTRASDKASAKDGWHSLLHDVSVNHTTTPSLRKDSTLDIRVEQPWSPEAWYRVGKKGFVTGDLWVYKCKVR